MQVLVNVLGASWQLLLDAAVYILFGILIGGLLKVFLSADFVAQHLGQGRYLSVLKAALLGIPLPLCSCGVLPAAAALKRQGANNGATTAFLISTPESGVDSIVVSYALLDPIMTVARPLTALGTAILAGFVENSLNSPKPQLVMAAPRQLEQVAIGLDTHDSFVGKIRAGLKYAFDELWGDLAAWFFIGLLLAGLISVLVPDELIAAHLGGGFLTMLLMLAFGIPLYICATASTPIAAALILKGISPGAALVFLLVGPATNLASLSVLVGLLGRRATVVYLVCIATGAIVAGLSLDALYSVSGISAKAVIGQAGELVPYPIQLAAALLVLALSIKPLLKAIRPGKWTKKNCKSEGCDCQPH